MLVVERHHRLVPDLVEQAHWPGAAVGLGERRQLVAEALRGSLARRAGPGQSRQPLQGRGHLLGAARLAVENGQPGLLQPRHLTAVAARRPGNDQIGPQRQDTLEVERMGITHLGQALRLGREVAVGGYTDQPRAGVHGKQQLGGMG